MCTGIERSIHVKINTGITILKIDSYIDCIIKKDKDMKNVISKVEKLIENTEFEIDYSECDVKDGFVYVVLKIEVVEE
jgi:hypothetical protein